MADAGTPVDDFLQAFFFPELFVLGAGIVNQMIVRLFTFQIGFDPLFLLSSAVSFSHGGGLGALSATAADLSLTHVDRLVHWPPGYSFLLLLALKLTRSPYLAVLIGDLAGVALFGVAMGLLLVRFRHTLSPISRLLIAFVAGWAGPFYIEFNTNVWAVALFMIGVMLLLPFEDGVEPSLASCVAGGMALGLTAFLRYLYAPLAVAPLLVTARDFFKSRDRKRFAAALSGWLAGVGPLIAWRFFYGKSMDVGRLGYPGHLNPGSLIKFYPFAADAIFGRRLQDWFPDSSFLFHRRVDVPALLMRHVLSGLVLLSAATGAAWSINEAGASPRRRLLSRFFAAGLVTMAVTVLFLAGLSIIMSPERHFADWVYVCEPRYFSALLPFILVGAAIAATMPARESVMPILKVTSVALFLASAVGWARDLPSERQAFIFRRTGGLIDGYMFDKGQFLSVVRREREADLPVVAVEVGEENNILVAARRAEDTLLGVPEAFIGPGERPSTSKPVELLLMEDRQQGQRGYRWMSGLCRDLGGKPFIDSTMSYCAAKLVPASGRQTSRNK